MGGGRFGGGWVGVRVVGGWVVSACTGQRGALDGLGVRACGRAPFVRYVRARGRARCSCMLTGSVREARATAFLGPLF